MWLHGQTHQGYLVQAGTEALGLSRCWSCVRQLSRVGRIDQSGGHPEPAIAAAGWTHVMHSVFQRWLLIVVGVLLVTASGLVDITYDSPIDLIAFALALIGLNAALRPIVVVLTLPVTVLTLGLFALAVNVLLFWLTAQLYWGVHVGSVFDAAFAALLLTIFTFVAGSLIR